MGCKTSDQHNMGWPPDVLGSARTEGRALGLRCNASRLFFFFLFFPRLVVEKMLAFDLGRGGDTDNKALGVGGGQ